MSWNKGLKLVKFNNTICTDGRYIEESKGYFISGDAVDFYLMKDNRGYYYPIDPLTGMSLAPSKDSPVKQIKYVNEFYTRLIRDDRQKFIDTCKDYIDRYGIVNDVPCKQRDILGV